MTLHDLHEAMTAGAVKFAVLDKNGAVLHAAGSDAEFRPHTDFPGAAACVVGGSRQAAPLLLHRPHPRPMPLVRRAAGLGWTVQPHGGWPSASRRDI